MRRFYGENPEYEHVVDMPPDDREEKYIRIEVIKPGRLGRCYMSTINRDSENIFYGECTDGISSSKFILQW